MLNVKKEWEYDFIWCKRSCQSDNRLYWELLEEENDGLYIQDIIRGGIKNDDARIPRNVSE